MPAPRITAAAMGGMPGAASNPSDPRQRPAKTMPAASNSEASTADAASEAAASQPWAGLSGSPYETALLALIKACRWRQDELQVLWLGGSNPGPECCQGLMTMSIPSSIAIKPTLGE